MIKRTATTLLLVVLVAMLLAACGAPSGSGGNGGEGGSDGGEADYQTSLQLGTGSVGGVYFPMGQEYANIFENNIDAEGFSVNAVQTGASVDNLASIAQGELQLGIAQNNTGVQAAEGSGEFEGAPVDNAGFMGQLYPEALQIVTLESTGIESVEDLEGQRVSIGPPGGATRAGAEAVLAAHGIEEGEYEATEGEFGTAQTRLQDGNLDAAFQVVGVPSASISELQATTGEVKLVSVGGEEIRQVEQQTGYEEYEIPADTYEFLEEPVTTVSAFASMYGSTDQVSEDLGYQITRTMYEQADELTLAQEQFITVEDALLGRGDVPLHPGAERYFREEGVLEE